MDKRNHGIDLLRSLLMLFIIIGHLFAHTGIRNQLDFLSSKWMVTWTLQSITVCAVNCFVIITGYYMFQKAYDLFRLIKLWSKVVFYSILLSAVLFGMKVIPFSIGSLLDAFFPVFRCEYWFFTMFILLYLMIPFLNAGLNKMTKKMHGILLLIVLLFFYIEPLFSVVFYEYDVTEGFSITAFVTIYIVGAYLARCNDLKKEYCVCLLILSCVIMLCSKILLEIIVSKYNLSFGTGLLYHNNSVFVLLNAVLLFELFKQLDFKRMINKVIVWINPSVFAVYLLHEKPAVRKLIWNSQLLDVLRECSLVYFCLIIVGIGLSVFFAGIVIDKALTWVLFRPVEKTGLSHKIYRCCQRYNGLVNL